MSTHRSIPRTGLLVAALLLSPSLAWSTVTLTEDNRQLSNWLHLQHGSELITQGPLVTTPSAFGAAFNTTAGWNRVEATTGEVAAGSESTHSSSLNGSAVLGVNSASISASSGTWALGAIGFIHEDDQGRLPTVEAAANTVTKFDIEFQLDAVYDYQFSGEITTSLDTPPFNNSTISTTKVAQLTQVGVGDLFLKDTLGTFNQAGQLGPGTYRMVLSFEGNILSDDHMTPWIVDGLAAGTLDLTLVPEPASMALIVLGGLMLQRRSR